MEERYEIRGKIGQGGLGAVYRGYDTRMSREVAIKRISAAAGDPDLQEESTRQLIKEAGALASLQHPHIVTIYDVGSDEDGPYVVMELISGKTLDELIERAPLTWPDFRELALQTQEALIAAQELDLIHSDLKPSNLMLTWLPSGKFQVKIVDFGLATLTHAQSKQDLEELEAVFGSIFFMAPEQFERVPLDARTDMYAIGCVYYQALTGIYPFDGSTAAEVMNAHLQHQVKPIQEVRADIPLWVCDWIMWHLNRLPADRTESARDALHVFLQNDKVPNPRLSTGAPPPPPTRQLVPGRPGAPVRLAPGRPIQPASTALPAVARPTTSLVPSGPSKTKSAPQPLTPPEGSKPSVHTTPQPLPESKPTPTVGHPPATSTLTGPIRPTVTVPMPSGMLHPKKPKPDKRKLTAAIAAAAVVLLGTLFLIFGRSSSDEKTYATLLSQVTAEDPPPLPVTRAQLTLLLNATLGPDSENKAIYRALTVANPTDGTDVDDQILSFALKNPNAPEDVRQILIGDVIRKRRHPASVPSLLDFARTTPSPRLATAALHAIRFSTTEDHFPTLLEIVQVHSSDDVRNAAEENAAELIRKSQRPLTLSSQINTAYINAVNRKVRQALLRLIARCGGDQATLLVRDALSSPDRPSKSTALDALAYWADESAFPLLITFLTENKDSVLQSEAFDAAFRFVSIPTRTRKPDLNEKLWTDLAPFAKSAPQQKKFITSLADFGSEAWAFRLIDTFAKNPAADPSVVELAEITLNRLRAKN